MYPLNLFSLFPPFPRNNKVFVAMSFDRRFDERWKSVIIPAVKRITVDGSNLEPYRVDASKVSDSILTEILTGISNCRLFFADITTIGKFEEKPIRNGNVMYELGLAQAVRLPEEVVLFKSDRDELLFDVASIRVHRYEPENDPEAAREQVHQILKTCLDEIDLQKSLAVRRAADSLDFNSWIVLRETIVDKKMKHPWPPNTEDKPSRTNKITAIYRLLDLGILGTKYTSLKLNLATLRTQPSGKEIIEYEITFFGKAVHKLVLDRLGAQSE